VRTLKSLYVSAASCHETVTSVTVADGGPL
jgi:hypothetical protein